VELRQIGGVGAPRTIHRSQPLTLGLREQRHPELLTADNGFIEGFNSKFRAECLNAHRFVTLADALEKLKVRRTDYNEVRQHIEIGYKVPVDINNPDGVANPRLGS
jgi:transposase InsO family protein